MANQVVNAVQETSSAVLNIVLYALIIGSLLGASVFTSLTIINTTTLQSNYGLFVTGLIAFFSLVGTVVGIAFAIKWMKGILSKKDGLQSMS